MKRLINGVCSQYPGDVPPALPHGVPGVFETVLWRNGDPVFWSAHWQRFTAGCRWHGFEPPRDDAAVLQAARDLTIENGLRDGVLRFARYRDDLRPHWVVDAAPVRPHMRLPSFRATWGPTLPDATPDRRFKHLDRARWLNALAEARRDGFDETVLCDAAGHLVEAAVSNLFLVRDGVLCTPDLRLGPLPGVVRAEVLTLAGTLRWHVRESAFTRRDLETAEEAWLTNSLIGVRPMSGIGDLTYSPARPSLEKLRAAWRVIHGWDPCAVDAGAG